MSSRSKRTGKFAVVDLSAASLEVIAGRRVPFPVIASAAMIVDRPRNRPPILVAYGGLCWRFTNTGEERRRCDLWLDVPQPDLLKPRSLALVHWARRMIRTAKQLGEPAIYCLRDDEPNSTRLLELVGLERMVGDVSWIVADDGSNRTGEVWRLSLQSEPRSP